MKFTVVGAGAMGLRFGVLPMSGNLFKGAIGTDRLRYTVVEGWHDNSTIYLHTPFLSCLIQFHMSCF